MADQAIEKQLNFYKSNFYKSSFGPRLTSFLRAIAENETGKYAYIYAESWRDYAEALKFDPKCLEKAAQFFDLDHKSALGRSLVAAILADLIFGTRPTGRREGTITWDDDKLVLLGRKFSELKIKHPKLSKDKIAERISQDKKFAEYKDRPRAIRVKLKHAYEAFERRKRLLAGYRSWVHDERRIGKESAN